MLRLSLPTSYTSDHSLVSLKVDDKPKAFPDMPFHRTNFRYTKADWGSAQILHDGSSSLSLFQAYCLQNSCPCLKMDPFLNGQFYTPEKNSSLNPGSIAKCSATIAYRIHCYNIYHMEQCSRAFASFRTVRKPCKGF